MRLGHWQILLIGYLNKIQNTVKQKNYYYNYSNVYLKSSPLRYELGLGH
jgi:hypothetical protein